MLACLPADALVINLGRGVLAALDAGALRCAALHVVEVRVELLPEGHTLFGRSDVLLTPHTSVRTLSNHDRSLHILLQNVQRYKCGEEL
jgi:phosphoglycerate dehydrogenase-like enzyme